MEERKMKDEEIIKALKFAITQGEHDGIGYWDDNYKWVDFSLKDILDFINRLQDEKQPKFGNWKVKFFKAQEEIERLTEKLEAKCKECREIADDYQEMGTFYYNETVKTAELQKQVDELKELAKIKLENEKNWGKIQTKQAVENTAKEIWNDITSYYFALRVMGNATVELNKLAEFWYKRGVEVE